MSSTLRHRRGPLPANPEHDTSGPISQSTRRAAARTATDLSPFSLLSHPLLRRLNVEAPGTYHHSLTVAILAEAAAESIGANLLLARIGAYFHDIGKLRRPEYFAENKGPHGSRRADLPLAESIRIITAHVKDGCEIARRADLPRPLLEIIEQHHGTALLELFYERKKRPGNDRLLAEQDFRYPGPRPRTREAAVVLLADTVEAASRTLSEPSAPRLRALVRRLLRKRQLDGQLAESHLTPSQLTNAQNAMARALIALFHDRATDPGTKTRPGTGNTAPAAATQPEDP